MSNRIALAAALTGLAALSTPLAAQNAGITLSNLVDGYVEVPYSPEIVPQGGITVEAWATYDDATIGPSWRYPTILRQNGNAGQESYFLRVEAGNNNNTAIRWLVQTTNGTYNVTWPFTPGQLLAWTHFAATWDGSTSRLFVNGMEVGSANGSGALRDQGNVLRIGKGSDVATPIEVWNGSIDEVRLWPYARSAAEIQATMNQALNTVPGGVSTWSFDNNLMDTSAGRHATMSGSVTYTNNVPTLTSQPFPGAVLGMSTAGCSGAIQVAPTSIPQVGNQGFGLVAHPGAPGSSTICAFSGNAVSSPFPLQGIDIWLDLTLLVGGYAATVDALGTAHFPLPIGATVPSGITIAAQFISLDACGPQGLTASNAIAFAIQP